MTTIAPQTSLFIGGGWHTSSATESIPVISPLTEAEIGSIPSSTIADIDTAVTAARRAFRAGRAGTPADQAGMLRRFADALEARTEDRARCVTTENGMPISLARFAEGAAPVQLLRYYADLVEAQPVEERRASRPIPGTTVVRREPVGVVAAISPWNFPAILSMFKIAPALASGCAVVLKPSPETTLDSYILAEAAIESGLPQGLLNIVTGGADVGQYLVSHPGIDKVAFTGSTRAGRQIGKVCGELLRPVTLELGGKSAALILDDADIAQTVEGLATASLLNTGQTCYMSTRILVPRSQYSPYVDAITAMAAGLPVGDPLDESTFIGPLVSAQQRARVLSYIDRGRADGATLTTGGGAPEGLDRGFFVAPTVFADVDNDTAIAREEIFGPVLSLIPYDSTADAIAIANDSSYGLGGTVWTTDTERGLDVARQVETGSFGVNTFNLDWGSPFGGVKDSGIGRELGPEGLAAYQNTKSIFLTA
ncbi:aldehyde dehydrogenase family protein [Gordonia amarae]|uniref:Aldehyde dehydrogenase family protein n=2 Tax=Gordonia amarae TaxID=36821 RepID=A0A857LLT8_9ACTN|nr:aldehyde dehydrogenase [Gordonia amarae]MCS3878224.1 acyl-CoA reductase-like NAD-dependent aldehyde dehydrogenase [Gordonia amarae]QHN16889.1 aldehyde dehydrogenase family protein [Gordonia amarae]QHN21414.1 aldehyde dehydrogenase family protein [Gordonia amarae]QHN30265.1 aldehyde dehydrogenase family protein [Gordonia amarae]QHN39041.1 aldehyde dehydrogenase family protein [Gordonia amarae]